MYYCYVERLHPPQLCLLHTSIHYVYSTLPFPKKSVNRHDKAIIVILAKYCIRLPDDGYFVIRNMFEYF